jgi:thioredoxin reductase (NADPH)
MIEGLRTLRGRYEFDLEQVDIDTDPDPALYARYDADVPVLVHGERELCRHRLDTPRVEAYLASSGRMLQNQ